jgi:hypothetical protein
VRRHQKIGFVRALFVWQCGAGHPISGKESCRGRKNAQSYERSACLPVHHKSPLPRHRSREKAWPPASKLSRTTNDCDLVVCSLPFPLSDCFLPPVLLKPLRLSLKCPGPRVARPTGWSSFFYFKYSVVHPLQSCSYFASWSNEDEDVCLGLA